MEARILVVDDEKDLVDLLTYNLSRAGFRTEIAYTGTAALERLRESPPDLLLLDVMLPDGDGFGFFTELKAERASGLMAIIFLSARGDTPAKVRALNLGAEDYLTKPFDALELAARVETVVRRRSVESMASPTTQLPGSGAIEQDLKRRLDARQPFAFCYLDLDNLKAFNDYYGYAKANAVIRQSGDVIRYVVQRAGGPGDFIGHIAGDDFVFITSAARADDVCRQICERFDHLIRLYYDPLDRERGYIETKDRFGVQRKFPIMSVSIAGISLSRAKTYAGLAELAAVGKGTAKVILGSSYVRDGETMFAETGSS